MPNDWTFESVNGWMIEPIAVWMVELLIPSCLNVSMFSTSVWICRRFLTGNSNSIRIADIVLAIYVLTNLYGGTSLA